MKTTYRKGRKLVVEEFDIEQMKDWLTTVIQNTNRKDLLVKIGNAVHGNDMCEFANDEFKIYTEYRGPDHKLPYEND